MRGLLKCKYILRRAYSQNDLQVSTEYREEKLNNDGILKYNPKVYCGNKTVLYCGKMKNNYLQTKDRPSLLVCI
jgi:hypothetical protein